MKIRKFENKDAEFCFKVRNDAYIRKFTNELNAEEIAACADAYKAEDYIKMAEESEFFLVEEEGMLLGFFNIKRINNTTAEIPLIYISLDHLDRGIGKACFGYIEDWITLHWRGVDLFFLDTIIPENNAGFYERVGFTHTKDTFCAFP